MTSTSDHADGHARSRPGSAPTRALDGSPAPDSRGARLGAAAAVMATWSVRFLVTAAALGVLLWVAGRLWVILLPGMLGLLLATVLWPPVRVLRRVLPPALASSVVLVVAGAVLVGLAAWLSPQVARYVEELADAATGGLFDLRDLLTGPPLRLDPAQVDRSVDELVGWLEGNTGSIAGGLLSGVATVGSILVGTLLTVVICFFVLKDGPRFLPWVSALAGPRVAPHAVVVARRCWTALSAFIRAQAAVGLVDAVAIGIGLAVMGVPLALPLAVLIFFGAFIPIIGATVTGILAALVALVSNGTTSALLVLLLVLVVQQLEGNVLQPMLVGHTLDLHPAVVILAVTAGGSLFGIVGAFLAVPVTSVGAELARYGRERLDGPAAPHHVDPPPPPADARPPADLVAGEPDPAAS